MVNEKNETILYLLRDYLIVAYDKLKLSDYIFCKFICEFAKNLLILQPMIL